MDKKYNSVPGAGHRITSGKQVADIRMFLQNPNGVMGQETRYDDGRVLLSLRKWGVDIMSRPKTNRNWRNEWLRNNWKSEFQFFANAFCCG